MKDTLFALRALLRKNKRFICIAAPIVFGLLYMFLCMLQLQRSIWFDESYSAYLTRFEYSTVWDLTAQDVHPPLYYFALKTWAHIFGHTDFAMRMLSVVCGAVAILFAYLWIKYKYGATAAIFSALLLSISPSFIRYGQEMRMYTMILAIVFAATYILQIAIDNRKKRWWVLYAILLAIGMWTHYFCALAWIAHLVYLIVIYGKKFFRKEMILVYVGAIALYLPWIPSFLHQTSVVQSAGFWVPEISAKSIVDYWSEALVYQQSDSVKNWLLILILFVTIAIIYFAVRYRSRFKLLTYLLIVPIISLIIISLPPLSSMFIPRYILFSTAAISLLAGVGLVFYARDARKKRSQKSARRHTIMLVMAAVCFIATNTIGVVSVFTVGNYNFTTNTKSASRDLYETITTLDGNNNRAIICASEWLYYDLSFYSTKEHSVYFMDETTEYRYGSLAPLKASAIGRIVNLDAFLAKRNEFWYITTIDGNTKQPSTSFPRDEWSVSEYSMIQFNEYSDTYAIVKMIKG